VTLQADEYGNGLAGRAHADLFATTMDALGLDPTPGAYIDQVPGVTLATDNLVSFLGLHRRWRGALVGHLAAFEMTSVLPMSRYASAVRRLIGNEPAAEFYDVHVAADVQHATIAAEELITGLAESDPEAIGDLEFGVAALLQVERRFSDHLLSRWVAGTTSLRAVAPTLHAGAVAEGRPRSDDLLCLHAFRALTESCGTRNQYGGPSATLGRGRASSRGIQKVPRSHAS
jgi:hypothetical protein